MKKKYWIYGAIILLIIGGGIFLKVRSNKAKSAVTYQTAQVTKDTLTVSVSGTGNVTVDKRSTVNPGISGEVSNLSVKVGDQVKKNQVLFKVINSQLDTQVDKAYVTYLQAKQSVENSKSQLLDAQNARSALDVDNPNDNIAPATDAQKAAADQKVTATDLAVQAAQVNVNSANADYQNQKETAAKRTVKAPMDGTITTLNITNGDQLSASGSTSSSTSGSSGSSGSSSSSSSGSSGNSSSTSTGSTSSSSAPIIIDDLSSLKASVSINEVDASKVQKDQKVSMTFDAIEGLTLTGKVEQISTAGANSSGVVTYPATISFDSLDGKVKPQMSVTATITTDVKQDVLMVPNTAVKTQNDTHYIQIMQNGTPVQQDVKIGSANDTYTEITEGLKEGDTVVTQTIKAGATTTAATRSNNSRGGFGGGIGGFGG